MIAIFIVTKLFNCHKKVWLFNLDIGEINSSFEARMSFLAKKRLCHSFHLFKFNVSGFVNVSTSFAMSVSSIIIREDAEILNN